MQSADRFVRLTDKPSFLRDSSLSPKDPINESPNDPCEEKKPEAILPVFVRQIHERRSQGHLTIFGAPTRLVVILGVLTGIDRLECQLVYHVRDDTGSIECFQYLVEEKRDSSFPLGKYVKVKGVMRVQNNKANILIVDWSPMQSLNELTGHLLEILLIAVTRSKEKENSLDDSRLNWNN